MKSTFSSIKPKVDIHAVYSSDHVRHHEKQKSNSGKSPALQELTMAKHWLPNDTVSTGPGMQNLLSKKMKEIRRKRPGPHP